MGKRKVEKLLEQLKDLPINWKESRAYADSFYDQDILKLVGEPVAVKPDEGLQSLAQKQAWRIMA